MFCLVVKAKKDGVSCHAVEQNKGASCSHASQWSHSPASISHVKSTKYITVPNTIRILLPPR